MIDLSFLTEAEQEAILKVLHRDSELKKAEEQRVRHLQDNVDDENELKYKSGQWFYDAKSKRHRDKIHGADLVRASIRKRKKPASIELHSVMDTPDEAEEDLMASKAESNQSAKRINVRSQDKDIKANGTASPAKQRKNPFNAKDSVDEIVVNNEVPNQEPAQVNGQEGKRSGTESFYAVVKKPSKSTSSDQAKDFDVEDALMESKFPGQGGKIEHAYESETPLEFGKSYGGVGKINFGSRSTTSQPGEVNVSDNDILAPEFATNVQSSDPDFVDDQKPRVLDDDVSKWRRPHILESEDLVAQPRVQQEFPNVLEEDANASVTPYLKNNTSKYTPGDYNKDTKYKSIFLRSTPEVEGRPVAPSPNFPAAQITPLSSRPVSEGFQAHETFLGNDRDGKDLPTSANFKVTSLKDRIHDTPREQMSNPSQFQSLKHFWNAEDKNWSKTDVDASPNRILTDVLKRNKPVRADLKQRNSKEIPAEDFSLPSSFDSLSEEEQTSQKVASWLAQSPTLYGAEQVDANEDQVHPGEEVMENIDKRLVERKNPAEEVSSPLQKQAEALEAPNVVDTEHQKSEDIPISPLKEQKKNSTTILVNSAEKKNPAAGFYGRVVQLSSIQSPEKETKIVADTPAMGSKPYPGEEVDESVERTAAPAKPANEFKISFQKLMEEYESASPKSEEERKVEPSKPPKEEQQLIEMKEMVEKSSVPKGNDHQEFISALQKLETEASTPPILENRDEPPKKVSTPDTLTPVKSSLKIGFEHLMPNEDDVFESPQKQNVTYIVQSSPPCDEDVVEKTTVPSRKDENDLADALKKLEHEATVNDASAELEDTNEKPKMTPTLQTAKNISAAQSVDIPSFNEQNMPSSSGSMKSKSALEDPYSNTTRKPIAEAEDMYVTKSIPEREEPKYILEGQEKIPVEEQPIERTIMDTEQSNADYRNQLMCLEEESAASVPEDEIVGGMVHVSHGPTKDVFVSKKVVSSNESMPTELPSSRGMPEDLSQSQPYAYKELANNPQSPSDKSGSFTGSAVNVPCKKPDTSSEVSKSKQGKPAPAGSPNDSNSSKYDKYTFEGLKAQDESISKVLDWFSRSSDSVDDQLPPVGSLGTSKTSAQQMVSYGDKMEDDASGPGVDALANGNEASQKMKPLPKVEGILKSKVDMKTLDDDQLNISNTNPFSPIEDDSVSSPQVPLTDSIKFGKSGSGCGKIQSRSSTDDSFQNYAQVPVVGVLEKDQESSEDEKEVSSVLKEKKALLEKDDIEEPMMDKIEGQSGVLTPTLEDESVPCPQVPLTDSLEFGNSGSGCGKIQNRSDHADAFQKYPQVPAGGVLEIDQESSEDQKESSVLKEKMALLERDDDIGEPIRDHLEEQTRVLTPLKDESVLPPEVPLTDSLEFGNSGSGCGKIQNRSDHDDSFKKYPNIPAGGVLEIDQESSEDEKEVSSVLKEKALLEKDDIEEPMKDKIEGQSGVLTPTLEDESVPAPEVPLTDSLEFGNSGSGCGKIQNRSDHGDSFQQYPQVPARGVLEIDQESSEGEKEVNSVLKENMASLEKDDVEEPIMDEKKDQAKVVTPTLEQIEDQSFKKPEKDKSIVPQKRVSDIKLLWERDRPSLDATKKPLLSNIKRPFSPVELPITPKNKSFDSDDQNSASLVTFKKVMVEDDEDTPSPVNQLKSFWENEKTKDTTIDRPSVTNEIWSDDKGAPMDDFKSRYKKRHTVHNIYDTEKSTDPEKNLPARSISVGESGNESLKGRTKPTSFQNLKSFWNVSSKSDEKRTNQVPPETMTKQFGSNPDLRSKEPFISRAKSRLAAKSLQDIREDPSSVSQLKVYEAEPVSRKFSRGSSKKEDSEDSVNEIDTEINPSISGGNNGLEKPICTVDVMLQESSIPSNYPKPSSTVSDECETKPGPGISEENQTPLSVREKSFAPIKIAKSEIGLRLKTPQDEVSGEKINLPEERPQSTTTFENSPDDQNEYRDVENGEMNEKGRKMLLVKQSGFDASSPVVSNVSPKENEEKLSENKYPTEKEEISDPQEVVNEHVERTVIPLKKDMDFDGKLQNLYNESLNAVDSQNGDLTEPEYMDRNEPEQNFTKVLAVSSGNIGQNIQSSEVNKSHQPIIINISSKKTEIVNEEVSKPQQNIPTETSLIKCTPSDVVPAKLGHFEQAVDISPSEVTNITSQEPVSEVKGSLSREPEVSELSPEPYDYENSAPQPEELRKKEIIERIENPVVLPRAQFKDFDEKLKQLYQESQNSQPNLEEAAKSDNVAETKANVSLYSSEPKKTFLESSTVNLESSQPTSANRESDQSAPSSASQVPDVLMQEINETVEKTVAPTRISTAKSLEDLQKEFLNEEKGGFAGNVPSGHMTIEESNPKRSDQAWRKNSEDTVEEGTEPARYEEPQEGAPETRGTFMSHRQSTPVKDKNGSLRKSTLELYLEAPYRREISKSIDFDISGYVASDANKYQNKVNNQKEATLAPAENSFPENAEKFKQMSQSVPSFLQDDTDGRETDSASESSFQIGRHKKSPSSLTNLSGSSGMASMSSVSGSVMSVYSGDFGNVDIKGSIEFAMDYVDQLKEFHIFIYQCKDLAAAEVKKQRSDPYVKAYLLPEKAKMGKRKTAVKKKTLNPVYNEILRYKIPKPSLQAQTLNLSVWHHDALGRNSFLGEVNQNLAMWDWNNSQRNWYQLEARTPASGVGLENRGEMKLSLKYIPVSAPEVGKKLNTTGEVHIWIRECLQLPMLRENKINSFVKCTILPDTSRKSRQKTRTVDKTPNPIFNHTMVYDGFKEADLREACVELTVWDHNKLSNHFLGGLRVGLGTGKSYGTAVDWMDSSHEESTMWEKMIASPNTWIDGMLPLRMFKMAKLNK